VARLLCERRSETLRSTVCRERLRGLVDN